MGTAPQRCCGGGVFDATGRLLLDTGGSVDHSYMVPFQGDDDDDAELAVGSGNSVHILDTDGTPFSDPVGETFGYPCVIPGGGGDRDRLGFPQGVIGTNGSWRWNQTLLWSDPGGCVVADLDRDGVLEMITPVGAGVVVVDAETGAVRLTMDNWQPARASMPLVADVNEDGHADIVQGFWAGDRPGVIAWEHDGEGRASVADGWHQVNEDEVSIDESGDVIEEPGAWWLEGRGVRARRVETGGDLVDLQVRVLDACAVVCATGPVEITIEVANAGRKAASGSMILVVQSGADGSFLAETSVPTLSAGGSTLVIVDVALSSWPEAGVLVEIGASQEEVTPTTTLERGPRRSVPEHHPLSPRPQPPKALRVRHPS